MTGSNASNALQLVSSVSEVCGLSERVVGGKECERMVDVSGLEIGGCGTR